MKTLKRASIALITIMGLTACASPGYSLLATGLAAGAYDVYKHRDNTAGLQNKLAGHLGDITADAMKSDPFFNAELRQRQQYQQQPPPAQSLDEYYRRRFEQEYGAVSRPSLNPQITSSPASNTQPSQSIADEILLKHIPGLSNYVHVDTQHGRVSGLYVPRGMDRTKSGVYTIIIVLNGSVANNADLQARREVLSLLMPNYRDISVTDIWHTSFAPKIANNGSIIGEVHTISIP